MALSITENNRIKNTFRFNSVKVIDTVSRSNKNFSDDMKILDTSTFIPNSPTKKVKNIFKNLKTFEKKNKNNSFSNSYINDENNNFKKYNKFHK